MRGDSLGARQLLATSVVGLLLGVTGCSGNGDNLDENGRPIDEGGGPASTFKQIQDTIFTPVCTRCHAGATAPRGLRLDEGNSYALLVGVASAEVPALQRVKAGDAENSYLVHKIEGRSAVGSRMPLGGPPLTQAQIDLVKQWIVAGARPPAAVAPSLLSKPQQSYRLVSSVPANAEETSPINQLTLIFNHEVDAALVQTGVFQLTASGGDGTFDDGNDTQVVVDTINVSLANPTIVYLQPHQPLAVDTYRLTLRGSGSIALADVDNNILDGNDDGIPGGDQTLTFTVVEAK